MTAPYTLPSFQTTAFNCPICFAYARIRWGQLQHRIGGGIYAVPAWAAICTHCNDQSYWLPTGIPGLDGDVKTGRMIHPLTLSAPSPHADMPVAVRGDYEEARQIAALSPRGAAALLRLAVQKLCVFLGQPGTNLNDDIGALVRLGLPVEIQQALDIVRVVGNNAVHPGELSEGDVDAVAATLFELVNSIVEDRIARPVKLQALFSSLPKGALEAIQKRDS